MWRELLGLEKKPTGLVDIIVPQRSFADVILPDETRQQLYEALTQIEKHRLIFTQWGLGERHPTGTGLVFNFAGPPGTGKTICAEAIAFTLGRKLMRIKYSELESMWVGETGKNIRSVFREAHTQEAVLFFDEADSIASRRFGNVQAGYEREVNQTVNILLKEVEEHEGVVIFATNLASNFDPAFERRIRTHILFRIPNAPEREAIWKVQVHPQKTPLADDVDFHALADRFEIPGGDIRNAVLKAAQMAAAEEGPDDRKKIQQRHLLVATDQVMRARGIMQQNSLGPAEEVRFPWQEAVDAAEERLQAVDADLQACRTELEMLVEGQDTLRLNLEQHSGRTDQAFEELRLTTSAAHNHSDRLGGELASLKSQLVALEEGQSRALAERSTTHEMALAALAERVTAQQNSIQRATLIPLPPPATGAIALLLLAIGLLSGHYLWP